MTLQPRNNKKESSIQISRFNAPGLPGGTSSPPWCLLVALLQRSTASDAPAWSCCSPAQNTRPSLPSLWDYPSLACYPGQVHLISHSAFLTPQVTDKNELIQPYLLLCACVLSRVQLIAIPPTEAHHAPLSIGFSRQEYWNGLPSPPPGDLPNPGIKLASPVSPALQADSLPPSHQGSPTCFHILSPTVSMAVLCLPSQQI